MSDGYQKYSFAGAVSISIATGQNVRPRQPVFPSIHTTGIFGGVVHLSFHWVSSQSTQSTHGNLSIVVIMISGSTQYNMMSKVIT
uniref:Uncharacterized protein n=1 Tax=Fagus sylvatica TaxID=28930 RepID=A0A2N9HAS0_FAGSY